jgi:hypothetical protein
MLGGKSATMTLDLYGHLFPDQLDEVADAMDTERLAGVSQLFLNAQIVDLEEGGVGPGAPGNRGL